MLFTCSHFLIENKAKNRKIKDIFNAEDDDDKFHLLPQYRFAKDGSVFKVILL